MRTSTVKNDENSGLHAHILVRLYQTTYCFHIMFQTIVPAQIKTFFSHESLESVCTTYVHSVTKVLKLTKDVAMFESCIVYFKFDHITNVLMHFAD